MNTVWGKLRRGVFGISSEETNFSRRGFRGATPAMRARLEQVGATFVTGYHLALEHNPGEALTGRLAQVDLELRGFAFEGAAMGLAVRDGLTPWGSSHLRNFLEGSGDAHAYMVHVGVGWLWARMPFLRRRLEKQLDPLLRWLAFDGWGFHEGFFHWPKYIEGQAVPARLTGYERRAFDQGLGRSFWFVNGGNPKLVAQTIASFAEARQADLWSGIGLAATYAGIVDAVVLAELGAAAGRHAPPLAQGAAFAAKARQRAGNLTDYTSLATATLCDLSAEDAARLCERTLESLPIAASENAYETWRRRIQNDFQRQPALQEH